MKQLKELNDNIKATLDNIKTLEDIENIRQTYLSKKGVFAQLMSELKSLNPEDRPKFGQAVNESKQQLESILSNQKRILDDEALLKTLVLEKIDVTLDGFKHAKGSIHPLSKVIEEVEDLFIGLGYEIAEGPELEQDLYNFEMMNMDQSHPARAMQDSFFITNETLLRTHTSPVQARTMLAKKGEPLRIICPGKTYRRDADDLTHSHQFMQIEGLVIDKNISFAQLKETLLIMVKELFGMDREIRLRPSYFPFTEPSVEVDVIYTKKDGTKGYIEVLGAGLVHPDVLRMGGYDPKKVSGFAFGIGVERIAILKYGVDDIRHFYQNDIRFLRQF